MPEVDIIYLNGECQVLRWIESYRQGSMTLPEMTARSALVLPPGRLSAARIQFGDRLEIHDVRTGIGIAGGAATAEAAIGGQPREDPAAHQIRPEAAPKAPGGFLARLFGSKAQLPKQQPEAQRADRRKVQRHVIPGTMAYFSIGSPHAQVVNDISTDGFFVRMEDRWTAGTTLLVGLQITNPANHLVEASISVPSRVVREGPDGIGFEYDDEPLHQIPHHGTANPEQFVQLQKFLHRVSNS